MLRGNGNGVSEKFSKEVTRRYEGTLEQERKVHFPGGNSSGITLAGWDIGNLDKREVRKILLEFGAPADVIKFCEETAGIRGKDALASHLKQLPTLSPLSDDVVEKIRDLAYLKAAERVENVLRSHATATAAFSDCKEVLIDFSFQCGFSKKDWPQMFAALESGDKIGVATEMLQSWAAMQTPERMVHRAVQLGMAPEHAVQVLKNFAVENFKIAADGSCLYHNKSKGWITVTDEHVVRTCNHLLLTPDQRILNCVKEKVETSKASPLPRGLHELIERSTTVEQAQTLLQEKFERISRGLPGSDFGWWLSFDNALAKETCTTRMAEVVAQKTLAPNGCHSVTSTETAFIQRHSASLPSQSTSNGKEYEKASSPLSRPVRGET